MRRLDSVLESMIKVVNFDSSIDWGLRAFLRDCREEEGEEENWGGYRLLIQRS